MTNKPPLPPILMVAAKALFPYVCTIGTVTDAERSGSGSSSCTQPAAIATTNKATVRLANWVRVRPLPLAK